MARRAARAGALIACAGGALAILLSSASAQTRTLTQVERDRTAATSRAAQLRREADAARREVAALDTRLVESGARRAEAERAAADAEQRLAFLRQRLDADSVSYEHQRDAFEAALVTAALTARRAEFTATRGNTFARAIAPDLHRHMNDTSRAIDKGRQLDESIEVERQTLADAQEAIDAERAEIVTLVAQRRAVQATLVANASTAERRVTQLAAEARSLRELAQRVAAQRPRTSPGSTSTGALLPTAWLAPAEGQITRNFGATIAGGPPAQGVALRTRAGAQVVAPASGEVAYAGLFRSYGQVLILNVDGGYALVFTGLDALRARTGETVRAGQPIGEMSASDTPAPELYVEVRRDGQPIDPARWLRARGLTAADQTSGRTG